MHWHQFGWLFHLWLDVWRRASYLSIEETSIFDADGVVADPHKNIFVGRQSLTSKLNCLFLHDYVPMALQSWILLVVLVRTNVEQPHLVQLIHSGFPSTVLPLFHSSAKKRVPDWELYGRTECMFVFSTLYNQFRKIPKPVYDLRVQHIMIAALKVLLAADIIRSFLLKRANTFTQIGTVLELVRLM